MKKSLMMLAAFAVFGTGSADATKHTVTFSGLAFSPATITITEGDTVVFVLSGIHNALEISQATWNVNGTTPLSGGFSVPFGGGEAVPSGTGTHYYICENHAASSMKGRIIVDPPVIPPSSITVSSVVDRDGNLGTTTDRMGKNWSLKIYKDSIGSGVVVDSVVSGWTLFTDSLLAGTYVAVEADSAHWTHISQTVNGSPLGPTSLNFRSITIGTGENHAVDFINYANNVVISDGFTFQPASITIDSSDTVRFVLDPMHTSREVDSLTWSADDTVSNGGFDLPSGGGDVVPSLPGTYYYVCVPHASVGMKGVIVVKPAGAISLAVDEGWNLLSMPFTPVDGSVSVLYPTATSAAFTYQAGYQSQSVVGPGKGYWLKFGSAQSVDLDGTVITLDTVDVGQGWNIVGSVSQPVPASSIVSDPGGLITSSFFGYSSGYSPSDTLHPGYGYWVKVSGPGSLFLQAPAGPVPAAGRIRIDPAIGLPTEPPPDR